MVAGLGIGYVVWNRSVSRSVITSGQEVGWEYVLVLVQE